MNSPTPTLPRREGAAQSALSAGFCGLYSNARRLCFLVIKEPLRYLGTAPSLRGRAGVGLLCLILCGCITDFIPKGIEEVKDILVVEGIITDDETTITLTRSVHISNYGGKDYGPLFVTNAKVYVECENGTQFESIQTMNGQYKIKTGKLNLDQKYCLKIEADQLEYCSDFSYPIQTPAIDSIFWLKAGRGQPVKIYLSTNSPLDDIQYYRWSYREDWEINAAIRLEPYPYYCWNEASSEELLLGTAEKTEWGQMMEIISEIPPSSVKFSTLYRVEITQNAVSRRAYDYFLNIKKNVENMGTIFAPIPSELRGNIRCITDPGQPVIGYVDVSTTTKKQRYIYRDDGVYEQPYFTCSPVEGRVICEIMGLNPCFIPDEYILYNRYPPQTYLHQKCVDCTFESTNTTQKPSDWPDHN